MQSAPARGRPGRVTEREAEYQPGDEEVHGAVDDHAHPSEAVQPVAVLRLALRPLMSFRQVHGPPPARASPLVPAGRRGTRDRTRRRRWGPWLGGGQNEMAEASDHPHSDRGATERGWSAP